jgi:hypothetical protein
MGTHGRRARSVRAAAYGCTYATTFSVEHSPVVQVGGAT